MNPTTHTFENLPEEKRERVLGAALNEFAEHGYHAASANRLARTLDIAKGSLFKYFGSKENLLAAVFQRSVERFKGPLKAARDETRGRDLFTRLHRILLAGMDFIEAHPAIYKFYLAMLHQGNVPLRETLLGEVRAFSIRFLRPLVQEARDRGELRPELDLDLAAYLLDAVMDRFLQSLSVPYMDGNLGLCGAERGEAERRAAQIVECLRRGLAA